MISDSWIRQRGLVNYEDVAQMRGAGEKQRCDVGVVVRNGRLAPIMDYVARIADHLSPLECQAKLVQADASRLGRFGHTRELGVAGFIILLDFAEFGCKRRLDMVF